MKEVLKENVYGTNTKKDFTPEWWSVKKEKAYEDLFETVKMLETRQAYRSGENVKHARLYSNLEVLGIYAGLYTTQSKDKILTNSISLNVTKATIDTVVSKIAKQKPRPMFLTDGGNWKLQQRAKQLTKFIDGAFDAMGYYRAKKRSFLDACVFGKGPTKFYKDLQKKQVACERIVPEELLVDDADAVYGCPKVLYHRRLVNRSTLIKLFPKYEDKIKMATNCLPSAQNTELTKELVKVVEGWRLPSIPGGDDGCHVMAIDTVTLVHEEWNKDWFPFVFEEWNPRLVGFWSIGIAEELAPIQIEINKILRNIQTSMHLFSSPRVFVANNSQVNLAALNNDIGAIVKYTGAQPPTFHTPQAMSADTYQHLWNLYQKAFEIVGVSQLSATSQKPAGLNSGVALREYQDIESDRFQITAQRFEETCLDAAKIVIEFTKEMDEAIDMEIMIADMGTAKKIKWKDVKLKDDQYMMRVFPASILPTTPAGKLQTITELIQAGFMDKESAMDLLDFPDIQAATSKMIAPRRIVFKMLDEMVDTGIYQPPEPYMNLQLAQGYAQQYYMDSKIKGVPEDRLALIRAFIDQAKTQVELAQQAVMQSQMVAQQAAMAPIAQPQAAPISDMMPMVEEMPTEVTQ